MTHDSDWLKDVGKSYGDKCLIRLACEYMSSPPESQSELGKVQFFLERGLFLAFRVKRIINQFISFAVKPPCFNRGI